jgi:hypothetical protein
MMQVELLGLPKDVLESILLLYCDSKSLAKLWQALASNKQCSNRGWSLLAKVIEVRLRRLPPSESKEALLPYVSQNEMHHEWTLAMQTRHMSLRISALEYCTTIPNVLWCGHMEFKDPMLPDWSTQHVRVVLCTDENWNLNDLYGWRSAFPVGTKLVSQMYNFVPVKPRGRLCGVSKEDAETLQDIRLRLENRDQVMTLRYRNDDGFIIRIISPEQANRRLAPFPNQAGLFNSFPDGLLCCWENPWDSPEANVNRLESVDHIARTYSEIVNMR